MLNFATNKLTPPERKLRGGYYTPAPLANFLASWAIRTEDERILEPSCGDGNFVAVALNRLSYLAQKRRPRGQITAIEIDKAEWKKAQGRVEALQTKRLPVDWRLGDFFQLFGHLKQESHFDVVLGNPPFIRFQHFDAESRDKAFKFLREANYKPTKLANAWVAFVQLSMELLKPGGRLAMVLPAELLQVQYAAELRERMASTFEHVVLVGFDQLVFPEIQQEVVLLLAEGKKEHRRTLCDIHTIQLKSGADLPTPGVLNHSVAHMPVKHGRRGMKWTALFLDNEQFGALDLTQQHPRIRSLGQLAQVDVGIVTGRNSFFVIEAEKAEALRVNGFVLPIVGRTSALRSIIFSKRDFAQYEKEFPSRLLNLKGAHPQQFSTQLVTYLHEGEQTGINSGYKCRIRARWYDVPSIYIPGAFLYRQIYDAPFLVANNAQVTATDTIHRVRVNSGVDVVQLCASSINSLSFAWAEVCGRSYGGGVLELEPREAEELPIPLMSNRDLDAGAIDNWLRNRELKKALDYVDHEVLVTDLGIDKRTVRIIREAWLSLRDRRRRRRH